MGYKIEPSAYSDVFVLPKSVVEKHIKLAGASQLKVLLWLFCRGGSCEDPSEISKDTGLSSADIADAMQKARRDIGQNANAKMVFFDLALQLTIMLRAGQPK